MSIFSNTRWLSGITLLLLTANIITLVLLWTVKKNPPPLRPPLPAVEFITKELNLDAVQQDTYTKLRIKHQADQNKIRDSINKAKDNLFTLLKQENIPDSLVSIYSGKVGQFEQERDFVTFKHFQKLRAICNKEQQIKFDSIIREVLHRMVGPKMPPGLPPGMEGGDRKLPPPGTNGDQQ